METPVNLLRATTTCNTFYVFLSAAKASLLPFLTLFFRLLGLSALETGIIMAAKTLTGFVWAPLWARCAVAYNKRRLVLVFSLLMMGLMYMSFTAVYYKAGNLQACQPAADHGEQDGNASGTLPIAANQSLAGNSEQKEGPGASAQEPGTMPGHLDGPSAAGAGASSEKTASSGEKTASSGEKTGPLDEKTGPSGEKTGPSGEKTGAVSNSSVTSSGEDVGMEVPTDSATPGTGDIGGGAHNVEDSAGEKVGHSIPPPTLTPPPEHPNTSDNTFKSNRVRNEPDMTNANLKVYEDWFKEATGHSLSEIKALGLSAHELYHYAKIYVPEANLTEAEIQQIMDLEDSQTADGHSALKRSINRWPRTLNITFLNTLKNKVGVLTTTLEEKKLLLFLVVLLVIIFGEFFSSPVEKIADDAWFDFLERIDDMEKYGRQRYWGSLAFALVPIIVAAIVDYTPCKMMFNLHHFLLHFYVFGIFIIFTLFLAFYFPMPPPVKQKYSSKVGKGLRVICCDGRGFLFVITLLVAGMVYASFNNFLFWRLQDLGAPEVTMGLCVSIGAFAETPMLVFSNKLVRKLGNGGVVALSLLALALRVLYYAFLWTPWAVLPAELTNAFTHTALWYAILSYDEFNVGSAMDRSIRSILSSMYFGLGFAMGSFVSGLVYHVYGASVLFWGASAFSGAWCLVYSIIQVCLPKKERVKYIKLLRKEEDDSSEGDDDWLEMALKDQWNLERW